MATRVEIAFERLRQIAPTIASMPSLYPLVAPTLGLPCCEAEIDELLGDKRSRLAEYTEFLGLTRRIDAADIYNGYFLFSPIQIARLRQDAPKRLHVDLGAGLVEVQALCIGADGTGNLFLMGSCRTKPGAVWKWNHEYSTRFDGTATD